MQLPHSQKQIPIGYEASLRARDRHTHACAVSRYEHAVRARSVTASSVVDTTAFSLHPPSIQENSPPACTPGVMAWAR